MKIKFSKGDPREGQVVQVDSSRGQQLIDAGSATRVKEDGSDEDGARRMPSTTQNGAVVFEGGRPPREISREEAEERARSTAVPGERDSSRKVTGDVRGGGEGGEGGRDAGSAGAKAAQAADKSGGAKK